MRPEGRLELVGDEWIWKGGPVAMLDERQLLYRRRHEAWPGTILQCGGYRIRVLKQNWGDFMLFVVRDAWYAPFFVFSDKAERSARLTKTFIIRLAVIWNLADYPDEGMEYGWHCLRPVRWAQRFYMTG